MYCLVDNEVLRGDDGVEAIGWAEDRREELKLRKEELVATSPGRDEKLMQALKSVEKLLR